MFRKTTDSPSKLPYSLTRVKNQFYKLIFHYFKVKLVAPKLLVTPDFHFRGGVGYILNCSALLLHNSVILQ